MVPLQFIAKPFFEPTSEALRFLPEGPRVLQNHPDGDGILGWVAIQHASDVLEGSLNILNLATLQNRSILVPGRPGFFCETNQPGVVLVGLDRRLVYCDLVSGHVEETGITVTTDERVIINDGLAIKGGVLFGTKHLEFNQTIAALYYYESATRKVRTLLDGQICSNGKFFQRDASGATLIDIDSLPKTITKYRFDAKLTNILDRSLVISPELLPGFPDGLRPSPDNKTVIVAFYNPAHTADGCAQQIRLSDGGVDCEWRIPGSPRVTCPEFVMLNGKVMILFTTAVEGMSDETRAIASRAGSMYVAETPFTTLPSAPPLLSWN